MEEAGADALSNYARFLRHHVEPEGNTPSAGMCRRRFRRGRMGKVRDARNAIWNLLADVAHSANHILNGSPILGLGHGWFRRGHCEYGYPFGTAGKKLRALDRAMFVVE